MKTVPRDHVSAGSLDWMPWEPDRSVPFSVNGAKGEAWVKILSWDPDAGAESLLYRFEPGWSATQIENTVPEDLVVWQGELQVGDQTLRKYGYSYRPIGFTTGPCSAPLGATIVSFCGSPKDSRSSTIAIPALNTESTPWRANPNAPGRYWKPLRADENTLDVYRLFRNSAGLRSETTAYEYGLGAIEEFFNLEGTVRSWYEAWPGRLIPLISGAGHYVFHGIAEHGRNDILEDVVGFKHDAYLYTEQVQPETRRPILDMFPNDTPAVKALKEGRDPHPTVAPMLADSSQPFQRETLR